ncbi:MAG: AzlC family ABC transporter permease [Sulfitobacter sp.]|nr:AzlC family ABC transporter permease [Sulfitobacter sp.]
MTSTTSKSAYLRGLGDATPFILVVIPFSMLFGIVSVEAGLSVVETFAFSFLVIAGAAQFTALQLLQEEAPTFIVLASALAVNLRMAMYSASLTPYIGAAPIWQRALAAYLTVDQSYILAVAKFEKEPQMTVPQRMGYFFGAVTPVAVLWYAGTLTGAVIGAQVPDSWALDFAIPITFLAMIAPMFRTLAHVVAAFVAVVVSLLAVDVPYSLGIIIAGAIGMVAGAQCEWWMERRKGGAS